MRRRILDGQRNLEIEKVFARFGVVIGAQHLPAGIRQHQTRIEARTQLLGVHVEYEALICLSIETVDILVGVALNSAVDRHRDFKGFCGGDVIIRLFFRPRRILAHPQHQGRRRAGRMQQPE